MRKAEEQQLVQQDLREIVSEMRKEEYHRALERAKGLDYLRRIELQVREDSKLSPLHRSQLLKNLEDASHS